MKKHIIILLALISLGCTVKAQTEQRSSLIDTIRKAGEHYVGWVRSHPWDNWTLDMNIGGHLFYGFEDTKGSLFKRVMPQFEAQLGHWIFPVVGIRGAFGTGSERGFITAGAPQPTHLYQATTPFAVPWADTTGRSTTTTICLSRTGSTYMQA